MLLHTCNSNKDIVCGNKRSGSQQWSMSSMQSVKGPTNSHLMTSQAHISGDDLHSRRLFLEIRAAGAVGVITSFNCISHSQLLRESGTFLYQGLCSEKRERPQNEVRPLESVPPYSRVEVEHSSINISFGFATLSIQWLANTCVAQSECHNYVVQTVQIWGGDIDGWGIWKIACILMSRCARMSYLAKMGQWLLPSICWAALHTEKVSVKNII